MLRHCKSPNVSRCILPKHKVLKSCSIYLLLNIDRIVFELYLGVLYELYNIYKYTNLNLLIRLVPLLLTHRVQLKTYYLSKTQRPKVEGRKLNTIFSVEWSDSVEKSLQQPIFYLYLYIRYRNQITTAERLLFGMTVLGYYNIIIVGNLIGK